MLVDHKLPLRGLMEFLDSELYPRWNYLSDRIQCASSSAAHRQDVYHQLYTSEGNSSQFLEAMNVVGSAAVSLLLNRDWPDSGTVVNVGGGQGVLACALAKAYPNLQVVVFDLPAVRSRFEEYASEHMSDGRVRFESGDFFSDPFPDADFAILGHILHNWPRGLRLALIRSAYDALAPNGEILVYDRMVDFDHPNIEAALASLDMLLWSGGGSEYTASACKRWLFTQGFINVVSERLGQADVLVTGRRDDNGRQWLAVQFGVYSSTSHARLEPGSVDDLSSRHAPHVLKVSEPS